MELMIENEANFKSEPALSTVSILKDRLQELNNSTKFPEAEVKDKFLHI
jgi:hypothetical protein